MADNRPRGRKRNVTEGGSGFHMREEGLGTGPVGGRGDPGAEADQAAETGMAAAWEDCR